MLYYDKKDEIYYFIHDTSFKGKLYRFKIIGYVLSLDDNDDCTGALVASQNREVRITQPFTIEQH